jgi:amino acid adenylation domain-containing protein
LTVETLAHILPASAATQPQQVAVVAGTATLTYQQLEQQVRELAEWLIAQGLQRGDRVGLCLPKSPAAVTVLYAVLQAGGVYVPADLRSPPARLVGLLADAGCRLVFTTAKVSDSLRSHWPDDIPLPELIAWPQSGPGLPTSTVVPAGRNQPDSPLTADAPAAILYTSGSTGRSKGVVLTHRNILCFSEWARTYFALQPADRVASIAPFHFDLSTFDLFSTHLAGGTLVLLDEQAVMFPSAVVTTFRKQQITACYAVPTTWIQLLERGALETSPPESLRQVLFAGEVFPVPLLRRLMRALPQAAFTNLYGPVETNVCTVQTVTAVPGEDETEIPIGRPLPHSPVEVLDDDGQPVAPGEVGQLCVWGPGVTPGYWQQPGLTESRRVQGQPDSYQTGDLAYRDATGTLWFRGRRDHQVKIRGHRIELGEVESALASHPGVAQAVAVVISRTGELQIVAFVQAPEASLAEADLHQHVAGKLAVYARPHRIIVKSSLPTTQSGKIDRQTLILWGSDD